jgi:glycosyltransferase involved in cell wall biosynthesis
MNILFIHQNFPGQFKFLAPALVEKGHTVKVLMPRKDDTVWKGVEILRYKIVRSSTKGIHPWLVDLESKTVRGEACFEAALDLKDKGFTPDVIIAHPGWGESMYLKDVWPDAKLGIFCEYFFRLHDSDVSFDPEFAIPRKAQPARLTMMNLHHIVQFETADAGISPTQWQAGTFPEPFRRKISVIHDGIDTDVVAPDPDVKFELGKGLILTRQDEVVTFVNRNLEPMRGFHIFMRALPEILKRRPSARVLIVGANGKGYGAKAPEGGTWKDYMLKSVRPHVSDADWARVHFLGQVTYDRFVRLLQVSAVHVYLTYPFVLSWSLMESMSAQCAIVASDTSPLREMIHPGETGELVDFFDVPGLADRVCGLLGDPERRQRLGENARAFVKANYDLKICLPRQLAWVESLTLQAARDG